MVKAYIHAGLGKCGSSALQTSLSRNPVIESGNQIFKYIAISEGGNILSGSDLTKHASKLPHGYVSSINGPKITSLPENALNKLANNLDNISPGNESLIISEEGWFQHIELFSQVNFFKKINLNSTIIIYIRPPAEWLNSAWWQWGAWTGLPFPRWLRRNINNIKWDELVKKWKETANVNKVIIRLLPEEIVTDFCQLLEIPLLETSRHNRGIPGSLLRLYQRQSFLRPGPHDSEIDFILARYLKLNNDGTPWILKTNALESIIEKTRKCCENMMQFMDSESSKNMVDDPRWWTATAYTDKKLQPVYPQKVNRKKLQNLSNSMDQVLAKLESENREILPSNPLENDITTNSTESGINRHENDEITALDKEIITKIKQIIKLDKLIRSQ